MKIKHIIGTISMLLFILINVFFYYKAKKARETSENILNEFKKVEQSLQDNNNNLIKGDSINEKEIDSLIKSLKDYK